MFTQDCLDRLYAWYIGNVVSFDVMLSVGVKSKAEVMMNFP